MAVVKLKPTSPGRRSMVKVVTPEEYTAWVAQQKAKQAVAGVVETPILQLAQAR
jgi:heme/copper-type cytochrome/quinol oxidase subunit 2